VLFDRTALKNSIVPALMFFYNLQNSVNYLIKKDQFNVLHLESDKERNEKINNSMMILAILVAFFEQVSAERNVYITVIAITILCLA
jgi:hypothetical protein